MMKWERPEIIEMNITETNYGGSAVTEPDDVFVNADGKWEATFVEGPDAPSGQ